MGNNLNTRDIPHSGQQLRDLLNPIAIAVQSINCGIGRSPIDQCLSRIHSGIQNQQRCWLAGGGGKGVIAVKIQRQKRGGRQNLKLCRPIGDIHKTHRKTWGKVIELMVPTMSSAISPYLHGYSPSNGNTASVQSRVFLIGLPSSPQVARNLTKARSLCDPPLDENLPILPLSVIKIDDMPGNFSIICVVMGNWGKASP
jgi:hypothetical protein